MRTTIKAVGLLLVSFLFVGSGMANFSQHLQERCDDLTPVRGCGHYQTMIPGLQERVAQIQQRDQQFIDNFLAYSRVRFARTTNALDKFRIAYLGNSIAQSAGQSHDANSAGEDYFANLFEGLGLTRTTVPQDGDLPAFEQTTDYLNEGSTDGSPYISNRQEPSARSDTSRSSSTATTTTRRSTTNANRLIDNPSFQLNLVDRYTQQPSTQSYTSRPVQLSNRGGIQEVRSSSPTTNVQRGGVIRQSGGLLELFLRAKQTNGQPASSDAGFVMVAVPDRSGYGGEVTALSYSEIDQAWYLSKSLTANPFDRLTVYLLCRHCEGRGFPYQGGFRSMAIVDRVNFQLRQVRYRPHRQPTYDPPLYMKSRSKSFAFQDAEIEAVRQGNDIEATIYLTIKNKGLEDGDLDVDDFTYRLTTSQRRLDRSDFFIKDADLDCDDARGDRVRMDPLSECEATIVISIEHDSGLSSGKITITHEASTSRDREVRLNIPYLASRS